ncbi:hypothetical protein I5P86_27195 [Pseudomonas glycinae]|uniref:hypothetical protein n=1 Tax=Pseudomonas glycinae TaxID=1785145 RepID=UPI0018D68742|nr:hypothetical protein [Pseudomonas glycinae]MBH3408756.1 hypothetical protein [Pseudomonas glycinae]
MAESNYSWRDDPARSWNALGARERELDDLRQQLAEREAAVEQRMFQDKKLLEEREHDLYASFEKRMKNIAEQEQGLAQRQQDLETQLEQARIESSERRKEYLEHRKKIEAERYSLELERQRLTEDAQKTLQDNSKKFVSSALQLLGSKETDFHAISKVWAVVGALSLLAGAVFAVLTMIYSSDNYHQAAGTGLGYYFFHLFRGLIVVGICGVLSRYAFIFSNSYMHESLKVGERAHAIRFGEFYLDTYGANAQWEQVKEAFAHWNISGQSAFSQNELPSTDSAVTGAASKLMDKALDLAADLGKKADKP